MIADKKTFLLFLLSTPDEVHIYIQSLHVLFACKKYFPWIFATKKNDDDGGVFELCEKERSKVENWFNKYKVIKVRHRQNGR